jgi:hypothetical protein
MAVSLTELQSQRRWVVWKLEPRPGQKKLSKVPYQPNGKKARNNDPATFSTYAECEAVVSRFDGIGMELGLVDGVYIVGIDLDECSDAATGKFTPESREVVIGLDSYTEYSPSGTGSHTWVVATLPDDKAVVRTVPGCKQMEIKGTGWYQTFTARHISKTPGEIMDRQSQLDALIKQVSGRTGVRVSVVPVDEETKFKKLMAGDMSDYDNDHNRADMALCSILSRRCHNNFYEIDRQFRKSGLYRDKWEREDYASGTILKVIQSGSLLIEETRMDEDEPAEWVIQPLAGREEGWFPLGEVSLVGGPSGAGKTHSLLKIAESARHGVETFGHSTQGRDYGILLHDRSTASMRRTCKAAKLPIDDVLSRVIRLTPQQQKERPAVIVEAAALNRPTVKLWILEGLDFWTPELHKLDVVGAILDELQRVASRHKVAIVGTLGSPKQKENDRYASGRDQFMGSVAFGRKSETCISISRTTDKSVRQMSVYTRNTGDEEFYFTWTDAGLTLTTEPAKPDSEAKDNSALHLMQLNVFAAVKPGDEILYAKSMGPYSTFFRWRRIAEAEGKVVKTAKRWYRTQAGRHTYACTTLVE